MPFIIGIDLLLKVIFTQYFKEAKDYFHGEKGEHLPDLTLYSFEYLQLFL